MKFIDETQKEENTAGDLLALASLNPKVVQAVEGFLKAQDNFHQALLAKISGPDILASERLEYIKAMNDIISNPYIQDFPDLKAELVSFIHDNDAVEAFLQAISNLIEEIEEVATEGEQVAVTSRLANMIGILAYYYHSDNVDSVDAPSLAEVSFEYAANQGLQAAQINLLAYRLEHSHRNSEKQEAVIKELDERHFMGEKQASIILGKRCVDKGDTTLAALIFAKAAHLGHEQMQKALALGRGKYTVKIQPSSSSNSPLSRDEILDIMRIISDFAYASDGIISSDDLVVGDSRMINPKSRFIGNLVAESQNALSEEDLVAIHNDFITIREKAVQQFYPDGLPGHLQVRNNSLHAIAQTIIAKMFNGLYIKKEDIQDDMAGNIMFRHPKLDRYLEQQTLPSGCYLNIGGAVVIDAKAIDTGCSQDRAMSFHQGDDFEERKPTAVEKDGVIFDTINIDDIMLGLGPEDKTSPTPSHPNVETVSKVSQGLGSSKVR